MSHSRHDGWVYVAIDQGGHATRASAYSADGTLEGAALVTVATQRNALGHVEHDPEEIVASVTTALAELARIVPPQHWAAAGFAVQRSSLVCWSADDGRALSPIISWQDTRNAAWLSGLTRRADDVAAPDGTAAVAALRREQAALVPGSPAGGPRRRRAGATARGPARQLPAAPPARGASLPCRRLDRGAHAPVVAFRRATGLRNSSSCSASRARCCRARSAPAHAFGTLACGGARVPVGVCNGDQSVVPFAAGPLDFDAAYVNLGTGAFVLRPTTEALHAPPLLTSVIRADAEHCDFVLEGSVNGAGAALDWLEHHQGAAADRLLALLGQAELADDGAPFFLNGVAGLASPFWRPDFESRFVGEGSDLQQCRAVLESVAFLIKANLDEMDRHRPAPARLVASGGLAENRLLCRMLACLADVAGGSRQRSRGDFARPCVPGRGNAGGIRGTAGRALRAGPGPAPARALPQVARADARGRVRRLIRRDRIPRRSTGRSSSARRAHPCTRNDRRAASR